MKTAASDTGVGAEIPLILFVPLDQPDELASVPKTEGRYGSWISHGMSLMPFVLRTGPNLPSCENSALRYNRPAWRYAWSNDSGP